VLVPLVRRRTVRVADAPLRPPEHRSRFPVDVDTRIEGQVLTGRYVLERLLGSGGAGVVWCAHDRLLQRSVAVKLLHPELAHDPATAARFRSEASSAAKLTHPNAVIVYDIGRDRDRDFLVMELVDGPALSEVLAEGPLPADQVAGLGASVASALGLAHQRGMLHRDVKPANVLLNPDGVPKVADFGIARALGEATARLTTPGSVMGTARYLAPEQLLDGPLDGRVDVYALGLVLHEALTGQQPWGDGSALEVASRRLKGDLAPPSTLRRDIPPELDAVVQRATRLEADQRFADGAAMAAALAPLAGGAGRPEPGRRDRGVATPGARFPRPGRAPLAAASALPAPVRESSAPDVPRPATRSSAETDETGPTRVAAPHADSGSRRPKAKTRAGRDTARPDRRRPRGQRRRRRGRRLLVSALLIGTMAYAGTQVQTTTRAEVTGWVQNSDAGELLRDVRDALPERLRR
jgi:hypothetical protein